MANGVSRWKVSVPVCSPLSFLKVMRTSINSTLNLPLTHEMATATVAAVIGGKATVPACPRRDSPPDTKRPVELRQTFRRGEREVA